MYTLKSIVRRGTPLAAMAAIVVATFLPAGSVFADALNPLTERSLMLSSSAPGFQDTDGSGNSQTTPNAIGENYAPAGSGPNGKKTGETFSFKMSSDNATIKAYTLQYCTTAAGLCQAPGNNSGSTTSTTPDRLANDGEDGGWANGTSDFDVTGSFTEDTDATDADSVGAGKFQVFVDGQPSAASDWTLTASNWEDQDFDLQANEGLTGKNNLLTLRSATGDTIPTGKKVEIVFKPSESVFITNPGSKPFFVKINTYNDGSADQQLPDTNSNIVDGGVTVANVMTDSIHITTKVLETMAFSVGTRNRDNAELNCANYPDQAAIDAGCEGAADAGLVHGKCDPVKAYNNNRLDLGNPNAENSLETGKAWDAYSYWRLSSNSSGGATVYYSGNTLQNTVGDSIKDMPTEAASTPGTEQFGLGFVDAGSDTPATDFTGSPSRSFPFKTLDTQTTAPYDTLATQPMSQGYDEAAGTIDDGHAGPGDAKFKFLKSSLTIPEPIAQENDQVISCATAKMRYVGNIGADTPAGVYTTKINYLAAPQY